MNRGKKYAPPSSGISANFRLVSPSFALSAAMRKSQASASVKPPGHRRAVHRRDHRLVETVQEADQDVHVLTHLEHRFQAMPSIARRVLKIAADIAARAKSFSRAGENHGANLVVVPGVGQRLQNLREPSSPNTRCVSPDDSS